MNGIVDGAWALDGFNGFDLLVNRLSLSTEVANGLPARLQIEQEFRVGGFHGRVINLSLMIVRTP